MILTCFLFIILSIFIYICFLENDIITKRFSPAGIHRIYLFLLTFAFLIRIFFASATSGHPIDTGTFAAWSNIAASKGLLHIYSGELFIDYLPGYIYILYIIGKGGYLFSLITKSDLFPVMLRLPSIITDIATAYILYRFTKSRAGSSASVGLSLLYAFSPQIILNSSLWGQADSFFTFFLILSLLMLHFGKSAPATALFAISMSIKPQTLIFAPLLLFVILLNRNIKDTVISFIAGSAVFFIMILPVLLSRGFNGFFVLFQNMLTSYSYASLNAFNLFALTGGNWVPINEKLLFVSYSTWSIMFLLIIVITAFILYFKGMGEGKLFLIAAFTVLSVFILSAKMHERYLYPFFILLFFCLIFFRDRRLFPILCIYTLTDFINVGFIFQKSLSGVYHIKGLDPVVISVSIVNVITFLYTLKVIFNILLKSDKIAADVSVGDNRFLNVQKRERRYKEKTNYTGGDIILIAILTGIFLLIALFRFGSMRTPETYWKPSSIGEGFYIDFGEIRDIKRIYYYCGLGNGQFNVDYSTDLTNWNRGDVISSNNIFEWKFLETDFKAAFIKITSKTPGATLYELGFSQFSASLTDEVSYKISGIFSLGLGPYSSGNIDNLFDEQHLIEYRPTFMTGMYFDEIYHARTGYEHILKIEPFESTHPPLGKLFISLGILLFGMNPFGWRIIGLLFGAAMIPVIYIFGKELFGKKEYAFISAFLMTFEFMHFVESRIATISVYSVFYILLMYFFMYKFVMKSLYDRDYYRCRVFLALAGASFSFGVACKWISLYAGAGLGILFFWILFIKYRERNRSDGQKENSFLLFIYSNKSLLIIAVLFFMLLPITVYFLSYIPFMMAPGPGHDPVDVVTYQIHMFNYHKNLKADHPFSSQWWEWPLIKRPVWYYTGQDNLPEGKISTIVSMGNPAVWWAGVPAVLAAFFFVVYSLKSREFNETEAGMVVIFTAFVFQYLPWISVSRLTFIYHFFASVPFLILSIVYVYSKFKKLYPGTKYFMSGYLIVVFLLFLIFYPLLSGLVVDKDYASDYLRWFDSWIFYS